MNLSKITGKLQTDVDGLSHYIELNTNVAGIISFDMTGACTLRSGIESLQRNIDNLKKEVIELDKIQNYNKSSENFEKPKDRVIKGKIPTSNRVEHPSHYTWLKEKCGIEVIDIVRHLNFNIGNVVKYVLRSGHKTEEGMSDKQKQIEDLQKAAFYINDEIERLSK